MNLLLTRIDKSSDGIFSTLQSEDGAVLFHTLEHAYEGAGGWCPKVQPGMYVCKRSLHRLHGMDHDFETFEITGVHGHEGILFHWGNYSRDSEGCVLVGENRLDQMITNSRESFDKFMALQRDCNEFTLRVA